MKGPMRAHKGQAKRNRRATALAQWKIARACEDYREIAWGEAESWERAAESAWREYDKNTR